MFLASIRPLQPISDRDTWNLENWLLKWSEIDWNTLLFLILKTTACFVFCQFSTRPLEIWHTGCWEGQIFFRWFTFFISWKQLPVSRQIRKRGELSPDLLFLSRDYESVNRSILVKLYRKIAFTILLTSRYINLDFLIFLAK